MFTSNTDEHAVKRHHALTALIQQEADRHAGLTFARFMELALYAPRLGYYEQRGRNIGHRGDFFTSVSVGPLFGELLACQFIRWLEDLEVTPPAVIVEAGAHDGRLAADLLATLQKVRPALADRVEYWVIEPSAERRQWQTRRKLPARRCRWFQSWTDLSSYCDSAGQPLTGIVFANELLDAMPFHRLRWSRNKRAWQEAFVVTKHDTLSLDWRAPGNTVMAHARQVETLPKSDLGSPLWPRIPFELLDVLPDGFTIEVSPAAMDWWTQAAGTLAQGWLMTLDYGLPAADFFTPARARGTARAYHRHQRVDDLLARPGEQDLTAHVNFTALELAGRAAGLQTDTLQSQSSFLSHALESRSALGGVELTPKQIREFQTLTHPDHLGSSFKVLVQSRRLKADH